MSSIDRLSYDKILLTILDSNPYLSDGSRQAIHTAADLARIHKSKVTVLVVDHKGEGGDPAVKMQVINKSLHEAGCSDVDILEKSIESAGSVLVGDVADEIEADLVLVSSEAVHTKQVDANLLAEFVPCPVLLLP
jgi:Set1/Ash2 histone methyltransferase complex subunit ASH2